MLKAGLIGCGSMGGGHLGNYYRFNREGDLLRLTCVCDIRRERLDTVSQETGEIRLYEDLDEMLANELRRPLNTVRLALTTFEHFGMMDDPEYSGKVIMKLQTYARNHIYPGKQLLMSFETSKTPLDISYIEKMLNEFILD